MNTLQAMLPAELEARGCALPEVSESLAMAVACLSSAKSVGESHQLLRRTDSKFVMPAARLPVLLEALKDEFAVLPAANERLAMYVTVYFDTEKNNLLHDHLRGRRPRSKVRIRHYVERRLSFLEVKTRLPNGHTDKSRRPHPFGDNTLTEEEHQWLSSRVTTSSLHASAWTACRRITLLAQTRPERLTIDVGVALGTVNGARVLEHQVIVEWKRATRCDSATLGALRAAGAAPASLSKYVAAMAMQTHDDMSRYKAALGRFASAEHWRECYA